jgi:hypothetical protein
MEFHCNLITKFAELFFNSVYSNNCTTVRYKVYHHIPNVLHVSVFFGHLQGSILTAWNMDSIEFTDAQQARTVYNYKCMKKNYLAASNIC